MSPMLVHAVRFMDSRQLLRMSRSWIQRNRRTLIPILVAIIVSIPAVGDLRSDSYPLSTYPMFSGNRPALADLVTVVGVNSDSSVVRLSPELIAGSDEPILASATVAQAIRSGTADVLCVEVAARVRTARPELVEVLVRTERSDVVARIAEGAEPVAVFEHARCSIGT